MGDSKETNERKEATGFGKFGDGKSNSSPVLPVFTMMGAAFSSGMGAAGGWAVKRLFMPNSPFPIAFGLGLGLGVALGSKRAYGGPPHMNMGQEGYGYGPPPWAYYGGQGGPPWGPWGQWGGRPRGPDNHVQRPEPESEELKSKD